MQEEDKLRVNRITVNINKGDDETIISLYKTNQLLGTINVDDLEIDSFSKSKVSAKAYQAYCKDMVINLLDNDGIKGFYYDPKEEHEGQKYGMSEFATACMEYVTSVIGDKYNWKRTHNDKTLEIDQYADKFIKSGKVLFEISIDGYCSIKVLGEMKSGQVCRPKTFEYNDEQYQFNITTLNRLMKTI